MALSEPITIAFNATILLGTDEYKMEIAQTITGIGNVVKRQVTVPFGSEVDLLEVGAAVGPGGLTDISFLIIQNTNATNFCRVRIADTGAHTVDHRLDAGAFMILTNTKINVSATEGAFAVFTDWDTVSAQFDTADGELIIFAGEPC